MTIAENSIYRTEIEQTINNINLKLFENKVVLITGVSGLIGRFLVDVLLYNKDLNINIIGLMRDSNKANECFSHLLDDKRLDLISCDINKNIDIEIDKIDYVFHLASNTHPKQYSTMPIDTIITNVIGTYNLLNFAYSKNVDKIVLASSVEVYGKAYKNDDIFDESYCGYIDCNTLRAGYPEAKRTAESLAQAFIKEKNLDIVTARLSRVFGPTVKLEDSKASSQFIMNALKNENIVLKSEGNQFYSYTYTPDVVSALIFLLDHGVKGEVYNVSNETCNISLKNFAKKVAEKSNTKVIFDLPSDIEKTGFSTAITAILSNNKIVSLGWKPNYDFDTAIDHTLKILKTIVKQ